jgi:hypothetical protein
LCAFVQPAATSGRHAACCLHVGAGFQPAHESPRAWTHRRLKTCGHFGQPAATSGKHAARCLHVGAGFQPAHEPPRAWTPRRLKTCGHFGQPAATSGNLWPRKTPPRTAPSWMPPAVRRLRRVLPVIGSSAPGAPSSRGQASFAVRVTQLWWLSPFSRLLADVVAPLRIATG